MGMSQNRGARMNAPNLFFSDEKRKFGALHFGDIPIWVTYGNLAKDQWTH